MSAFQEVKIKHRSLREVLPPKPAKRVVVATEAEVEPVRSVPPEAPSTRYRSRRPRRWLWWSLGVLVLLALIYFVSLSFASVTVEITPAQLDVAFSDNLVATKSGAGLNFDVVTLPAKVASRTVKASGTEKVSRRASGQIIIYNNYSKDSQKLIANTRFQAKNDKIYRLREAIIVPGMKTVAGKLVPGSVEATVYADEPGATYNGEATDFTIPGFKGDPRFSKFYARSKTSLSGGIVGEVRKLSPEEAEKARKDLSADLTRELLLEARAKIPATFVLFDSLTLVDIKDVSDLSASTGGDSAILRASATFQGVMLPRQALTEALAKGRSGDFDSTQVTILNLDQLPITFSDNQTGDLAEVKNLTLNLSSSLRLIPNINSLDLSTKLAGISKLTASELLDQEKSISKYRLVVRPIWLNTLPADPAKIEVKLPAY